ncbi:MAG TPA: aminoglycoside phosphotransferase family protein [Burkholderiaceae bacterium]|jgi:aminoglycoside phosphotransferase (APT) family kinase protein|nr:aminoglycoside phosphotransferase family protein [Burkholderiaceae bacterium]
MRLDESDALNLTAALRRMSLIAPDETPELEPLTGGVSSLIVLAHTRRGPVCVKSALARLKVAAEWLAPVERNTAEVAWMRLAAGVVPDNVPAILGEDQVARAFAMAYLDPRDHPVWKTLLLAGEVDVTVAVRVARALVAVHRATAGRADLAAAFAHDASFFALRLDPYLGAAARAHPDCASALHALIEVTAGTRLVLVHGDISPKNILCGPAGPVILDAECAWYGDPAFDLAFVLNHLLLKCAWRPDAAPAYLSAFDALFRAYREAVDWEPASTLEQRAARLLGGLLLARIDGKSPVEYLTLESQRDPVRKIARGLLLDPPETIGQVRAAFAAGVAAP